MIICMAKREVIVKYKENRKGSKASFLTTVQV